MGFPYIIHICYNLNIITNCLNFYITRAAPVENYVTQIEYKERQARLDDENRRQNHRIEKLEEMADRLTEIALSVKALAVTMEWMRKDLSKYGSQINDMEKQPADNWNKLILTLVTAIASAAVTWIFAKGGI